jgi:hypothetical protein
MKSMDFFRPQIARVNMADEITRYSCSSTTREHALPKPLKS